MVREPSNSCDPESVASGALFHGRTTKPVRSRVRDESKYNPRKLWSLSPVLLKIFDYRNSSKIIIRGAVTKFPELWYSTVMVGHMTTLI